MSAGAEDVAVPPKSKVVLEVDAFPFKGLDISEDWKKLEFIENRTVCAVCKKSRKYFCYTCYVAVPEIQHFTPKIQLPVKVDVIKHAREMDGKSTAVHAAVLAPEDVNIYTYPAIPDYDPQENVVLIFPNPSATSVKEICEEFYKKVGGEPASKRRCSERDRYVVHRAVFIDSTWNQSRGIFKDSRIKSLPSVVLKSRLSQFWRHQADSPRWYLATVEAIHQFFLEVDRAQWELNHETGCGPNTRPTADPESTTPQGRDVDTCLDQPETVSVSSSDADRDSSKKSEPSGVSEYCYDGKYDNLLFFFRFMYSKIHTLYDHDQLRSYKRRLE